MDQETNEPLDDSKTSEDDIEMENDPFSVKTWKEDLKLIVEDKDIYVSKTVLALLSPVFEKMFESAFKEKDSNELPLPDKRFNSFVEFLQCVYPGYTKSVTAKTACSVVPLAHEYQMTDLLGRCDVALVNSVGPSSTTSGVYSNLKMAHLYNLEKLQERCIELASERSLSKMMANKKKFDIPSDLHEKVLARGYRRQELDIIEYKAITDYSKRKIENFSDDILTTGLGYRGYGGYMIRTARDNLPKEEHKLFDLRIVEKIEGRESYNFKQRLIQKYDELNDNMQLFQYLPLQLKEKFLGIQSSLNDKQLKTNKDSHNC